MAQKSVFLLFIVLILAGCGEKTGGAIDVFKSRARPAQKGMSSAAYMEICNTSGADETLLKVECADAGRTEIHESFEENGLKNMRSVRSVEIPEGETVEFRPGGFHVMLIDIKRAVVSGDSIALRLHFKKAGVKNVIVRVQ